MPADALTKLATDSRQDLLHTLITTLKYRISYCEVSGRRETMAYKPNAKLADLKPEPEEVFLGDFGDSESEGGNDSDYG